MYITNDPYADFDRHDARQARKLARLPRCAECGETIQTECCYHIGREFYCEDCISDFREYTDDYIED